MRIDDVNNDNYGEPYAKITINQDDLNILYDALNDLRNKLKKEPGFFYEKKLKSTQELIDILYNAECDFVDLRLGIERDYDYIHPIGVV